MATDKDELVERVVYLEKRITDQAEELTCLKSALADCLRRVQLLEKSRGRSSPNQPRVAPRTASESRGQCLKQYVELSSVLLKVKLSLLC